MSHPLHPQGGGQQLHLRALAAAIEAFEGQEFSALRATHPEIIQRTISGSMPVALHHAEILRKRADQLTILVSHHSRELMQMV